MDGGWKKYIAHALLVVAVQNTNRDGCCCWARSTLNNSLCTSTRECFSSTRSRSLDVRSVAVVAPRLRVARATAAAAATAAVVAAAATTAAAGDRASARSTAAGLLDSRKRLPAGLVQHVNDVALKLVDVVDKVIAVGLGDLGVGNMNHILQTPKAKTHTHNK